MATTKYRLAEEIMLFLNGGRLPAASKYSFNEIIITIGQVANKLLKLEYFNVNLAAGEMIPNGLAIATYENILVSQYKNTSGITLPAMPLHLPRGMGVYQIFPPNDSYAEFVPLQLGQASMITNMPVVSGLSGLTGYEQSGTTVQFTKDLTTPPDPVYVTVRMVIMDVTQYNDYTPLPLLPEQEFEIKDAVIKMYSGEPIPDKLIDPGVKENRQPVAQQIQA